VAKKPTAAIHRHVDTLFNVGATGGLSDGQLLDRFLARTGEGAELAFAALVERHGPMVLRVCRGLLRDEHEAQDAFQATFLILACRAGTIRRRESAAGWLLGVARRVASCARSASARRRVHERRAAEMAGHSSESPGWDGVGEVIHEELARLPRPFREAVLVCDLEGLTEGQAAQRLGWPLGTVRSRLARGRDRLRRRLVRRGLAPAVGALGVALAPGTASATPPAALVEATVRAASRLAAGRAAAGIVSGSVEFLMRKAMKTMLPTGLKLPAALLLAFGGFAAAAGLAARTGAADPPRDQPPPDRPPAAAPGRDDIAVHEVRAGAMEGFVVERGNLEATKTADVFCRVPGNSTILSLLPEGKIVKKDQLVCELDSSALRDQLVNQEITTRGAEANFENARLARQAAEIAVTEYVEGIGKRDLSIVKGEIDAAQAAIRKAEERLDRTRRARQRVKEAMAAKGNAATPADIAAGLDVDDRLEATELALDRERRALELGMIKRDLLEKYTGPRTIKELNLNVERARSDELAKQATWEQEKAKQAKLERQIADCKLYAPIEGYVVYANEPSRFGGSSRPQIEEGATIRERQLIFRVVDRNSPMRVNTKVQELWVDRLTRGQQVRVLVDAFPGVTLPGVVQSIAPLPDPNAFFAANEKVYTTMVDIEKGPRGLRPGMSARVEIPFPERRVVLSVPVGAVLSSGRTHRIAVQKPGGGFEWRDVKLGLTDGKSVEIWWRGVKEGDRVALDPRAAMGEAGGHEAPGASPEAVPRAPETPARPNRP
jgi:HlyD family secretion protein